MSNKAKLITNGRGIFKRLSAGRPVLSGWVVVEDDMSVFEDPHTIEKNNKRDIVAKLNQLSIPHDGRKSVEDLQLIYDEFVEIQGEEGE